MTVYAVALFLHIVGALGLFAALALEWTALSGFRRSTTAEQVTDWSTIYGALRRIGPVSIGLLLVFGLYMMATAWGPTPWIGLGILALVVIAALGAFNGIQITRVLRQNAGRTGPLSSESRNALHRPTFVLSLRLRTALALGVVLIMTVKTDLVTSVAVLVITLALGAGSVYLPAAASAPLRMSPRT
ncbi:MAG: hypothetical protein E6H84_01005 [Chloroflexi bacterium]|nr:MAG: hypothetical protein E6H84_01005 [Chloroflexota bacterium]